MADSDIKPPVAPRRKRWLGILGLVAGIVVVLVLAAYFAISSPAFVKGFILPRVSDAIHASITVRDVSVHPFSEILVHDLKIQAKGQEPIVAAPEVHVRYRLFDILRGHIRVNEATLISPTFLLVENPDGTSNLDPLRKTSTTHQPSEEKPSSSSKAARPMQVDVQKFKLSNATFTRVRRYGAGHQDWIQLTNINVTLDQLRNGQPGTLVMAAGLRVSNRPPSPGASGSMEGTIKGTFNFSLLPDLKPAKVNGETRLEVSRATGVFGDLPALNVVLKSEITPTEIRELALHFARGSTALGQLVIRGPLDIEKMEGRLTVELGGIDRHLLNLAGAAGGLDFGTTTINSTNELVLARSGSVIGAKGFFQAGRVQLIRAGQTTPAINLDATYDLALDRSAQNAIVRRLTITGTRNGSSLLSAQLTRPMNLGWGSGAQPMTDSALDLSINALDLAEWKMFLGDGTVAGNLDLKLKLSSQGSGKRLSFDLNSQGENLAFLLGAQRTARCAANLVASGQATDLKHITLTHCQVQLTQKSQPATTISGSGNFDLSRATTDLKISLQASLPDVLPLLAQPRLNASAGTLDFTGHWTQSPGKRAITGDLDLKQWTGLFGDTHFNKFGTSLNFDVGLAPESIQINKITGKLSDADRPGGAFGLAGSYTPPNRTLQLSARLSNVNQYGLKPFLNPWLAGNELTTVMVNGDASVRYAPKRDSAVKVDLQVTNLVVTRPAQGPTAPLEAKLQFDAAVEKQTAEVHQCQLTLTPTSRAKNQIQLQGHVDFSNTNAIGGNIQLIADSLDVTRYYDLFGGRKNGPAGTDTPAATSAARAAAPNQEPLARTLPFRNLTAQVDIGRAFLREIEIGEWQTTLKLDGSHVLLQPCRLALNGSTVTATADADLGVPGWKYRVSLDAGRVPIRPVADSLATGATGQYNGVLTAVVQISGTGFTGTNLKKYLNGDISLNLTNASIPLIQSHTKFFLIPINVNLIASLLNVPEITRSPVTGANVKIKAGKGQLDVQEAEIISPAFLANVRGAIPIANVLTDSPLNLPVEVSLTNSLARKLIFPGSQTTATNYVRLPVFLTVTGTIGQPESRKNAAVLTALTIGAATGLADTAVGTVLKGGGGVVNTIGGLVNSVLGGGNTNTSSQTNQPAAPRSGIGEFLDHIIPK